MKEHSIRLFAITAEGALTRWDLLSLLVRRWTAIESYLGEPGPLVCAVSWGAVTPLAVV